MNRHNIGFVVEQALGHVTHAKNLKAALADDDSVNPYWVLPTWEAEGLAAHLPLYNSNWTVRAGLQARRGLARLARTVDLDALFFHTQVPAMLALDWIRRVPTVVSLDATPRQYDRLGAHYDHQPGPGFLEAAKWQLARRVFREAQLLVTWSDWVKRGLVDEYQVAPQKIKVIPPGVDAGWWSRPQPRQPAAGRPLRILFVGGDLERKGGQQLLAAFRRLRAEGLPLELHLVTRSPLEAEPGVFVYRDMSPNTDRLRDLFFRSDIFCLPTRADTLGLVLAEAGASGLPAVTTDLAGIPEVVRHEETGLLVPLGDQAALVAALRRLLVEPQLRLALGRQAAKRIQERFDAQTNARRLLHLLQEVAESATGASGTVPPAAKQTTVAGASGSGEPAAAPPALLTVSGELPRDLRAEMAAGHRPLPDYVALATTFPADLIDYELARPIAGRLGRLLERLLGADVMLAWACFRLRHHYRLIFTDGEQVGLPLAFMLKFLGGDGTRPRHLMITHLISVPKKQILLDRLHLQSHIDRFIVYSTWQKTFIEERWQLPPARVAFIPFMVDGHFFAPEQITPSTPLPDALRDLEPPLLATAGLEFRDYPTLIEAVRGLDVQVVIAAASPWSQRADSTEDQDIPPNVIVRRFSQHDLRHLYALSEFVVMPLYDVNFQAGITAILEAMAMGKAVVCSRTPGQTDVLVDGETGLYVPPEDPAALRRAIRFLLDNPDEAARMGQAARAQVESQLGLRHYARRLARWVGEELDRS